MSLFVIGDTHLSLGTDKPMDLFRGWDNYVSRLTENWKKLVKPEDTVAIAGDISWAMKLEDTYEDFCYINALPGTKILLKGNHDYWWNTLSKINAYLEEKNFNTIKILYNNSFEVGEYVLCGTRGWTLDSQTPEDKHILNRECGRLRLSLESAKASKKEPVVFLHYPPILGDTVCSDLIDILIEYDVKRCYYGHIHGSNMIKGAFNGEFRGITFKLISGDAVNFTPVLVR